MIVAMFLMSGFVMAGGCATHRMETNVTKTGSNLQIVSFNQDLTTLEVMKKMDEAGLSPAVLEEIMKEPKRATANGGLIYALGSGSTIPGDARTCYTVPGCPDRDPVTSVDVKMFCGVEYQWPAGTNFGALPK